MFLGVAIVSVILSACTDSEIKKMNGEWKSVDPSITDMKLEIKGDKIKAIYYSEYNDKSTAEKNPLLAKIYKEGEQYKLKTEDGMTEDTNLIGDNIIIDDVVYTKIK